MIVELELPGADATGQVFLTWTPVQAEARLVNPSGTADVNVTLRNVGPGGRLRFARTRTHLGTPTLALVLPMSGTPVRFFVAGEFGRPSVELGDAVFQARRTGQPRAPARSASPFGSGRTHRRFRQLSAIAFFAAFGTLNGGGAGRFRDFRDMHVMAAINEAHGNVGFLPWHRAYLLDLERELQAIDPSVALPYWRFDRPAPNVFTRASWASPTRPAVEFTAGHPLEYLAHGRPARHLAHALVRRRAQRPRVSAPRPRLSRSAAPRRTRPTRASTRWRATRTARAHTSFIRGFISDVGTAARDPLFFMLHANVDRLWAKWQWIHKRTNPAEARAFAAASPNRVGHRLATRCGPGTA